MPDAPAQSGVAKAPRRWLRPVIVAVLLAIIGSGTWLVLESGGQRTLSADEQELVRMWIERAHNRVRIGELVIPAADSDGSALQYLRKVLQKDPGNARAQQMLGEIAARLRSRAETELNDGNLDSAADLDAQGLQVAPGDDALKALRGRIADARARDAAKTATGAGSAAPASATHEHLDKLTQGAVTAADLRAAVGEFMPMYRAAPERAETLALRARLLDAIGTQMHKSANTAEFDGWVALLDQHRDAFAGDPAWAPLQQARGGWRARVVAAALH
jgi:hypothetical protein